jgi:hypothetical protein
MGRFWTLALCLQAPACTFDEGGFTGDVRKKTIQHIEFMYTVYHNLNENGYLMPKMGIDWLLIGVGVVFELLEDFEGSMIYSNRANAPDTFAWYRNGRDWLRMASIKK